MFFFSREKPKIKSQTTKKDSFSGWLKCSHCQELIHGKELNENYQCCPKCNHHYRISSTQRIQFLCDGGQLEELEKNIIPCDPLNFTDSEPYSERLQRARKSSGLEDAIVIGKAHIGENPCILSIMDFQFMGGSMGSVVGEKITRSIEMAIEQELPFVTICSSGGARMQEGVFSLMQMAKTSAALAKLSEARLPYISILTNPTTGGVTASFASLGDIILAEPGALICFAGPRVIEQVIGHQLPEGAQRSEFLLEHGMIDRIVARNDMKQTLAKLLPMLCAHIPNYSNNVKNLIGNSHGS